MSVSSETLNLSAHEMEILMQESALRTALDTEARMKRRLDFAAQEYRLAQANVSETRRRLQEMRTTWLKRIDTHA